MRGQKVHTPVPAVPSTLADGEKKLTWTSQSPALGVGERARDKLLHEPHQYLNPGEGTLKECQRSVFLQRSYWFLISYHKSTCDLQQAKQHWNVQLWGQNSPPLSPSLPALPETNIHSSVYSRSTMFQYNQASTHMHVVLRFFFFKLHMQPIRKLY